MKYTLMLVGAMIAAATVLYIRGASIEHPRPGALSGEEMTSGNGQVKIEGGVNVGPEHNRAGLGLPNESATVDWRIKVLVTTHESTVVLVGATPQGLLRRESRAAGAESEFLLPGNYDVAVVWCEGHVPVVLAKSEVSDEVTAVALERSGSIQLTVKGGIEVARPVSVRLNGIREVDGKRAFDVQPDKELAALVQRIDTTASDTSISYGDYSRLRSVAERWKERGECEFLLAQSPERCGDGYSWRGLSPDYGYRIEYENPVSVSVQPPSDESEFSITEDGRFRHAPSDRIKRSTSGVIAVAPQQVVVVNTFYTSRGDIVGVMPGTGTRRVFLTRSMTLPMSGGDSQFVNLYETVASQFVEGEGVFRFDDVEAGDYLVRGWQLSDINDYSVSVIDLQFDGVGQRDVGRLVSRDSKMEIRLVPSLIAPEVFRGDGVVMVQLSGASQNALRCTFVLQWRPAASALRIEGLPLGEYRVGFDIDDAALLPSWELHEVVRTAIAVGIPDDPVLEWNPDVNRTQEAEFEIALGNHEVGEHYRAWRWRAGGRPQRIEVAVELRRGTAVIVGRTVVGQMPTYIYCEPQRAGDDDAVLIMVSESEADAAIVEQATVFRAEQVDCSLQIVSPGGTPASNAVCTLGIKMQVGDAVQLWSGRADNMGVLHLTAVPNGQQLILQVREHKCEFVVSPGVHGVQLR